MHDLNKFFATTSGKCAFAIIFLIIGFFSGMQYKSYQIKSVITDSLMPAITGSLDDARVKANDASIKSYISSLRAQGVLSSADGGYTYPGICSDSDFAALISKAETASGHTATCNVSKDTANWAVAVPLASDSTAYACSDSTGTMTTIYAPLGNAAECSK